MRYNLWPLDRMHTFQWVLIRNRKVKGYCYDELEMTSPCCFLLPNFYGYWSTVYSLEYKNLHFNKNFCIKNVAVLSTPYTTIFTYQLRKWNNVYITCMNTCEPTWKSYTFMLVIHTILTCVNIITIVITIMLES